MERPAMPAPTTTVSQRSAPTSRGASGATSTCIHSEVVRSALTLAISTHRLEVDLLLAQRRKFLIGGFFFLQRCRQKLGDRILAEFFGPRDKGAVSSDLIVLHRLRGRDQRRVQHVLVVDLARHLVGLIDDAVDSRTLGALRFFTEKLERLVETL